MACFYESPILPRELIRTMVLLLLTCNSNKYKRHFRRKGTKAPVPDLLRSVQMLKREWGTESKGKLPQIFIPSKTATLVAEFAVEDLPLGRTAAWAPEFAVKTLSDFLVVLGRKGLKS